MKINALIKSFFGLQNMDMQQSPRNLSSKDLKNRINAALNKNICFRFSAKGYSMFPFIKNNDLITISPLGQVPLAMGDIVAYLNPQAEKLVVHRIVGKMKEYFLIKGDISFAGQEDRVKRENILGRVNNVKRGHRSVCGGLGLEKTFIAILSRMGIFAMMDIPWTLIRNMIKGKAHT